MGPRPDRVGNPIARAMIQINISWFVFLDLALFLSGILILWTAYEMIRKRRSKETARARVFCRICGSRYIDTSGARLLDCPVCGSVNERGFRDAP
jgi:hypothetical protein